MGLRHEVKAAGGVGMRLAKSQRFGDTACMEAATGRDGIKILLISGPGGIGKSTLSWAISARLAGSGVAHAAIESDELDRVFPKPTEEELAPLGVSDISATTLAALWSVYASLGRTRLLMSGVFAHPEFDKRWILHAIPGAEITVVRLRASDETLAGRIRRREHGEDADGQIARSLRQSRRIAGGSGAAIDVDTDGKTPAELADSILRLARWDA